MISKEKYTTPLAAGGQWISSWIDNDDGNHGDVLASVAAYSDQSGQYVIQQSADRVNPNLILPVTEGQVQVGGQPSFLQLPITHLFWRVVYTNGSVAQTTFEINVKAGTILLAILLELQKLNFANRETRGSSSARDEWLGYPVGR